MYSLDELKKLVKILEDSNLTSISIKDSTDEVKIEKAPAQTVAYAQNVQAPVVNQVGEVASKPAGKTIDSPMVGVFYSASGPDKPPFVTVGQKVKKGDVVCIIEAMKIMNEITAEESGTIQEILVSNGDVVEFGQPMFTIG